MHCTFPSVLKLRLEFSPSGVQIKPVVLGNKISKKCCPFAKLPRKMSVLRQDAIVEAPEMDACK